MNGWDRVIKLRQDGKDASADRLARKLMGVMGEPMSEAKKEYLRQWKKDHADDLKQRREFDKKVSARTEQLVRRKK